MKKTAHMHFRLLLLLPAILLTTTTAVLAQGPTLDQKAALYNRIDTLMRNYLQLSTFTERGKPGISPAVMDKFAALFISKDILIPDEMEPTYFDHLKGAGFPSFDPIDQQAAKLRPGPPVYSDANGSSLSKLKTYQGQVDAYIQNFNDTRPQFFGAYNGMNGKIDEYHELQLRMESIHKRNLADIFAMSATNYPDGFTVRLINSAISFRNIAKYEVDLVLVKRTSGIVKVSGLRLENLDTVVLQLKTSENYTRVSIAGIDLEGFHFNFINDKDHDFVIDTKDACPDQKGFQNDGCPFPEEKGYPAKMRTYLDERAKDSIAMLAGQQLVTAKVGELQTRIDGLTKLIKDPAYWWLTLGVEGGTISATTTNATNGYKNFVNTSSMYNNPNTTFTSANFIGGDLVVEHFFDKAATVGLSLGVSFLSISGTAAKSGLHVEYEVDNAPNLNNFKGDYRQIIEANSGMSEKESITNIAVPLLFIFKTNPSSQNGSGIGFKLELGGALDVQYKSTMSGTPSTTFNYGAVLGYSNSTNTQPPTQFDPGASYATTDWIISTNNVPPSMKGNVAQYFAELAAAHYPVGYQVKASGMTQHSTATFGSGFSLIARPSVTYFLNKGSYLSLGVYFSYNSVTQSGSGYRVVDETQSNYYTLMQGISKLTTTNIGIRLSYSHSLFYNVPKWTRELSSLQ